MKLFVLFVSFVVQILESDGESVETGKCPRGGRDGYIVTTEEHKVLVPPYGKFVTMEVLFEKPPDISRVTSILASEVKSVVDRQSTKLDTTAYAKTGVAIDKAGQTQIRGKGRRYLSVEFDAKSGQMRDQDDAPVSVK